LEFPLETSADSIQNLSNINIEDISKEKNDSSNFSETRAANNKPETNAVNHVKN